MARELVHEGRKIKVYLDTSPGPDGTTIRRDVIWHPGAVVILPMVDADTVCLLRNERFIVGETLWELPAGTLEPGEEPERAAHRELQEETGYTAGQLRKLVECYASPGCISELLRIYVAEELTAGPQALEADEQIEVERVPWAEAVRMVFDNTIRDSKTLTAILMWDRLRTT